MQPSGEVERFEVDDQPSPPADRSRYSIQSIPFQPLKGLAMLVRFVYFAILVSKVSIAVPSTVSEQDVSVRDKHS